MVVTCGKAEAGDEQIVTDPKLIIEVLSPSTKDYDRRDKFVLYRSLPSLREYALIDPAERRVDVFTLAGQAGIAPRALKNYRMLVQFQTRTLKLYKRTAAHGSTTEAARLKAGSSSARWGVRQAQPCRGA